MATGVPDAGFMACRQRVMFCRIKGLPTPAVLGARSALHQLIGQDPLQVSTAGQRFKRRPLSSYFAVVLVSQIPS